MTDRQEELETKIGHIALGYYTAWIGEPHSTLDARNRFLESKYYPIFIKFARDLLKNPIDDPECFVRVMKQEGISPSLWKLPAARELYQHYRHNGLSS